MTQEPASYPDPDPEWDGWLAFVERREGDEPPDLGVEEECECPWELGEIVAEARQAAADQAAGETRIAALGETAVMSAIASAAMGRRGPGMPGSASLLPGEYSGPAGGFATGQALDVAPGGPVLLGQAERAAGDDGRFDGAADDELLGIICAADRCEAAASALKHAAVAALIRWPSFCVMMEACTTGRSFWRKPSSGRACTGV